MDRPGRALTPPSGQHQSGPVKSLMKKRIQMRERPLNDGIPVGRRHLLWKLRGAEIRREQLTKCRVEYDGWASDVEKNNAAIRELQELLAA
jgi:hypothetical protein